MSVVEQWWHDEMSEKAAALSNGVLNEMKRRIETTNICKEKLTLNESSLRMKIFFDKETARYEKRIEAVNKKHEEAKSIEKYKSIVRKLLECNISLAKKCIKNKIEIEKVVVVGKAVCYR
jgi:hypothetical protein